LEFRRVLFRSVRDNASAAHPMNLRSNEFAAHVLELLEPLGSVTTRRMFSGTGFHHGGAMFAMIIRDELYFKVGERNRADFAGAGQQPFSYATKNGRNTIHSLWSCPPE